MFKKVLFIILFLAFAHTVNAANLLDPELYNEQYNQTEALRNGAGIESVNVQTVIAKIIYAFLGLLGIIFVILIIIAGFNWMTANGDETKIEKAQKTIKAAIIGLIIIVAAYSITKFVFEKLPGGSSSGSSSVKVTDSGSF